MPETVRLVSDGEEMVLSEGEAFRIHPGPVTRAAAVARSGEVAAPKRFAIQYMGFSDVDGRREYVLSAQQGDQRGRYTVWIELAAFSRREALLQDGPDICYQKLLRELTGAVLHEGEGIAVTGSDLAAYREAHAPPPRRSFSPARPAEPPKTAEDAAPGKDGEVT